MKSRIFAGIGILVWICGTRTSLGQTAVNAADIFERGKKLMDAGDLGVACPMIQQSYDLEPKVGRLYTLATCRDREGRIAKALELYRTYLQSVSEMNEQTRPKHADREKTATERVQAIEGEVPKLKLVWQGSVPKDAKVKVDESDALARLNTEWPMDPGEHWVVVERGGHAEAPRVVKLESGKAAVEVDLTPPEVITAPKSTNTAAEKPLATPKPLTTSVPISTAQSNSQRGLGIAAIGVGGTAMVAGGVLGVLALVEKNNVDRECITVGNGNSCTRTGMAAQNDGRVLGNAATVPLIVGAALAVTGFVLVFRGTKANVRTSVMIDGGAVITVGGTF